MKKQLLFISALAVLCISAQAQTILGVDVSHYQGSPNWSQVKSAGITFAYAKATEGTTITDASYVYNQTNGTSAGLVMGAYHFARPENNTAVAEANYFLSVAGPYIKSCCLPPALDMEDPPGGPTLSSYFTPAQLTSWAETWMQTVYDSTGIRPVLYTDGSYSQTMYTSGIVSYGGLWMADPDGNSGTPPATTGVWPTWDFKQWSFTGTVTGISGQVDEDVFNGTTTAFTSLTCSTPVTANFTSNITLGCPGMTVKFTDKSTSTGSITGWNWTFTGGTPSSSTLQNPSIVYNTPGTYSVKEVVKSTAGNDSITKTTYIHVNTTSALPLIEGFQSSTFPPAGWVLNLPNPNDSVWELCKIIGYSSTQCMYFPANCGNVSNISGERQQLYTPNYSFTSATKPQMWFDVAYEPSSVPTYSDTLVIYYSLDCGTTWKSIYSKGGMTLCTTGGTTKGGTDTSGGCFVPPNTKAWRIDSVNISALAGKAAVMFSFESRSGWGNIIYIDNINISGSPTSVQDIANSNDVKVYPNPSNGEFTIEIKNYEPGIKNVVEVYNTLGQEVYTTVINSSTTQVNLNTKSAGMYFYRIMSEAGDKLISEGKIIVR
jgi:GH25 family lysozyme M1 (1,4-beta-N-acetylmuramidase)